MGCPSDFYSVAGTAEDPGFLNWALVHVRQASIDRHATEAPSIALDDPATEPLSASGPGAPLALEHCGPIFLVRAHSMVFKL